MCILVVVEHDRITVRCVCLLPQIDPGTKAFSLCPQIGDCANRWYLDTSFSTSTPLLRVLLSTVWGARKDLPRAHAAHLLRFVSKQLLKLVKSVSFSCSFLQRKRLHCLYVRGEPAYPDSTPWWPSSHVTLPPALDEQCGAGRFQTSCAATRGLRKWWRRWGVTRARGHDGQQPTLAARRGLGLPEGDNHGAQQSHVHDCQGEAPSAFPQILIINIVNKTQVIFIIYLLLNLRVFIVAKVSAVNFSILFYSIYF